MFALDLPALDRTMRHCPEIAAIRLQNIEPELADFGYLMRGRSLVRVADFSVRVMMLEQTSAVAMRRGSGLTPQRLIHAALAPLRNCEGLANMARHQMSHRHCEVVRYLPQCFHSLCVERSSGAIHSQNRTAIVMQEPWRSRRNSGPHRRRPGPLRSPNIEVCDSA